jgi:NADH-quinone oxidoreductase subunit J
MTCILALLFAVGVVAFKHPVRSAMSLFFMMFTIAFLYGFLNAHFIAVLQIIIYVGAIMVLLIYVAMLVDTPEEMNRNRFARFSGTGFFAGALFVGFVFLVFRRMELHPVRIEADFGSVRSLSEVFIGDHALHFELASLLLLVGVAAVLTLNLDLEKKRAAK